MAQALLLGTHNKDKCAELQRLLGKSIRVVTLTDFPKVAEAVENGRTFEANAKIKARAYSKHAKMLTLADDSGLMVNALSGKPGVYSARYAGVNCTYTDNNRKLLKALKNLPPSKRQAKFVCVMALYDSGRLIGTVRGECHGRIAPEARGANGFGYDPVFIPKGYKKTFAELSKSTKNKVSHRGKALRLAKKLILTNPS